MCQLNLGKQDLVGISECESDSNRQRAADAPWKMKHSPGTSRWQRPRNIVIVQAQEHGSPTVNLLAGVLEAQGLHL